jgi:ketosteroid isomerase-like protein
MDDLQTLMIERACTQLIIDYCHFVDHGQAAKLADQFTEDGVWAWGEAIMDGQDAIRRGFEKRQAVTERMSRHVCTNLKLEVIDADHAEGVTYLILFRHDGEPGRATSPACVPDMVGEYRDRFTRTADGWRFQHRELVINFMHPTEAGPGSAAAK